MLLLGSVATIAMTLTAARSDEGAFGANAAGEACPASRVMADDGPVGGMPWVESGRVAGVLFYATSGSDRAVAPLGRRTEEGRSTKVLWVLRDEPSPEAIIVEGRRLDGESAFRASVMRAKSPANHYPSVLDLPGPGCWALTIDSGIGKSEFVFLAVGPGS